MVAGQVRGARVLSVFTVLFVAVCLVAPTSGQPAKVGSIGGLVGEVEIVRGQERFAAAPETELIERDVIVTGERAWVSIALADGSELAVGGSTTLVLNEYLLGDDGQRKSGVISLLVGIVRAFVSGGNEGFVIDTQAAIASARSTDFIVDAGDGDTAVFVVEGVVAVSGVGPARGQSVELKATEGTDVDQGQPPQQPLVWGKARVDTAIERCEPPS